MSDVINIVVRIMPGGDELEVELPIYSTGKEIKEELLDAKVAPRTDPEGVAYVYDLIFKRKGAKITDEKTLYDLQIEAGDTLFLAPRMNAG
ncbi:MAG: hypothetical protein ACI85O_003548 [Saprospiraceae bacterium]|jgi:hypothetical protein